jgi:predicted nucleotidyltransferase
MTSNLDIKTEHKKIVSDLLEKHLPPSTTIWVFGSRAKGTAKKYSDLDLAIQTNSPLSSNILANLKFDLEESDLPYKVDIVDWNTLSDSFKKHIEHDRILLKAKT